MIPWDPGHSSTSDTAVLRAVPVTSICRLLLILLPTAASQKAPYQVSVEIYDTS